MAPTKPSRGRATGPGIAPHLGPPRPPAASIIVASFAVLVGLHFHSSLRSLIAVAMDLDLFFEVSRTGRSWARWIAAGVHECSPANRFGRGQMVQALAWPKWVPKRAEKQGHRRREQNERRKDNALRQGCPQRTTRAHVAHTASPTHCFPTVPEPHRVGLQSTT